MARLKRGINMSDECFVLIENGEPIGVAPPRREEMAKQWAKDGPNRQVVKVPECT
jgi:hypothetical protein